MNPVYASPDAPDSPVSFEYLSGAVANSMIHVEERDRALALAAAVSIVLGMATGGVLLMARSPRRLEFQLFIVPAFAVSLVWLWIASKDLDRANANLDRVNAQLLRGYQE